jgi:methionyl-tRNA formyltransferase
MKLVVLATGEIALPAFRALLDSEHEVLALVTQPDKAMGRRSALQPPAIKVIAEEVGIPVLQPKKVRASEALDELRTLAPEMMVVMAYGQILPQALIDIPKRAIINLHASLLPKYRGASCIQSALINGDEETGWTVMHVVKALDAGDIIAVEKMPIAEDETGGSLHDRLAEAAPAVLLESLASLEKGEDTRIPQDGDSSSYAPKLERNDGLLDWTQPAEKLERLIRALYPWPGTFTTFQDFKGRSKRLKIFPSVEVSEGSEENKLPGSCFRVVSEDGKEAMHVVCGRGALLISQLQPEGARRMEAAEFLRGVEVSRLGQA